MRKKGTLDCITGNCLIGFDAEWTKNYKIKNGNIPFCFSIIAVDNKQLSLENLQDGNIHFEYIQYYCENRDEFKDLVLLAEKWLSKILEVLDRCVLCGHQISSDFSVLYNAGKATNIESLKYLEEIRNEWHKRKEKHPAHIVDTRYDIYQIFLGKSRRLVDMCTDFELDVTQPELKKASMTKLQNLFYDTNNDTVYERISVMNLRHSLCAVVLCWLNERIDTASQRKHININKSVYKCLKNDFSWITSEEFSALLDR